MTLPNGDSKDEGRLAEGWMTEKPPQSKVYHYIVASRSLCGRYGFYAAGLQRDHGQPGRDHEDCAECFKRLRRRKP